MPLNEVAGDAYFTLQRVIPGLIGKLISFVRAAGVGDPALPGIFFFGSVPGGAFFRYG